MRRIRTYEVSRVDADRAVLLTGTVDRTMWEQANATRLDEYARGGGSGPETTVRALFDAEALCLQLHVKDDEIIVDVTELNGSTFEDSPAELFAMPSSPDDGSPRRYCNFEASCRGTLKLAWQESNWRERDIGRDLVSTTDVVAIEVETSVPGPTKTTPPNGDAWWLAA